MLGDYLRALGEQVQPEAVPYDLAGYLSDRQKTAGLGWLSEWNEKDTRRRVLREAAVLGAELLGADEPETVA